MRTADVTAQVIAEVPGAVVVQLHWREPDRPDGSELFQVFRLRDGSVVDMQDYERRGAAMKAVSATT